MQFKQFPLKVRYFTLRCSLHFFKNESNLGYELNRHGVIQNMDFLQDDRIQWIRQKVALALGVPTQCFNEHFTETLERATAARLAREQMLEYLSAKRSAGSTLFFSSNSWTEIIEGVDIKIELINLEFNKLD